MARFPIHLIRSDSQPPSGVYELSWHFVDVGGVIGRCDHAETARLGSEWRSHLKLIDAVKSSGGAAPILTLSALLRAGWRRVGAGAAAAFVGDM